MEQVIFGGSCLTYPDDTGDRWNSLVGGHDWCDAELPNERIVGTDGTIKDLRVKLASAPGDGKHFDFTLILNGALTALTVEIAGSDTTGSDTVNEIDVTGGDTISLKIDPDNTPTVGCTTWTSVFESDTANESLILGGENDGPTSVDTIYYGQVMGGDADLSATENDHRQVCPTAGTIKDLYVKLDQDPGTDPDAYRFTLRKGGVSQTLTVTITADDTTGNDLVNSFAVVAGDVLTMMIEPLNTPANEVSPVWGMIFVADTDGESIVMAGTDDNLHNTTTEYNHLQASMMDSWNNTETWMHDLGQSCVLKKLYILLSVAPGAGNSYTFSTRVAGADGNLSVTISDTNTTGNDTVNTDSISDSDYTSLKCVPDSTPDAADAYWGFVSYIEPPSSATPLVFGGSGKLNFSGGNRELQFMNV